MSRLTFIISALLATQCALAAIPQGYYDNLDGKNKGELKNAAKLAAQDHSVIEYGDPTWAAFRNTDTHMVDGRLVWWDMYSNNLVDVESGHPGLNIEHSVANSWWGKTKNAAYKDLFHLNPSDAEANNRKSNYPLGKVNQVTYTNGITIVGKPVSGTHGGAPYVYEPADCYKGDFARVFFYIFTIYDDINWSVSQSDRNFMFDGSAYPTFRPWAYQMLLEWAKNDPVDDKERARNEEVYKIQHNRNPFIDFPDLPEYIWGSRQNESFHPGSSVTLTPDFGSPSAYSPTTGSLCVTLRDTPCTTVRVYDLSGRQADAAPAEADMTFHLPTGVYIVTFGSGITPIKVNVH